MDPVGEIIDQILHSGGKDVDGVTVDTYVIKLRSGECFQLETEGAVLASPEGLQPDPAMNHFLGLKIVGVETSERWPTSGIRLESGAVLVMGSPTPYYWGLYDEV